MVITEYDYDTFINSNKILSTYISNLFITKTLLLIGYSFDDSDIRTLWQIIGGRLGKLSTPAYVVLVEASPIEIACFERRNIKVINIRGNKSNYPDILTTFFNKIKELIDKKASDQIVFTNEKATEELKIPQEDSKLCFISAPFQRISFLKELLYPILQANGISPISLDEAIMPGEILTRKIDTLISKSYIAVVDLSGNNANVMWELGNAMSKNRKVILIVDDEYSGNLPSNLMGLFYLKYNLSGDNTQFINSLNRYLLEMREDKELPNKLEEHFRLLSMGEFNAAVIIAFRLLEITIADQCGSESKQIRFLNKLDLLEANDDNKKKLINSVRGFWKIRNYIVHTNMTISKKEATDIVQGIDSLCKAIQEGTVYLAK